jgi:hypothetical protein
MGMYRWHKKTITEGLFDLISVSLKNKIALPPNIKKKFQNKKVN